MNKEALSKFARARIFQPTRHLDRIVWSMQGHTDQDDSIETKAYEVYKTIKTGTRQTRDFFFAKTYNKPNKVIKKGKGVCFDRSMAYVILARAHGIPACIANDRKEEHTAAAIQDERGEIKIVDISKHKFYKDDPKNYELIHDIEAQAYFKKANWMTRAQNLTKAVLISLAVSATLYFVKPYVNVPQPTKVVTAVATFAGNVLEDIGELGSDLYDSFDD